MIASLLKKVFGSRNDRLLKLYGVTVRQINALEGQMQALSDTELQAKTAEFKERLGKGETPADILPEAFAVCREASKRVMNMRHFDVQLIGGMALNDGKIAEMRTGEGKTLVGTLPTYLNALSGKGVHVVTVNDYLAQRDANTMAKLYNFLGLTVGVNLGQMPPDQKRVAYGSDITYGTNNEFGFDYLRDNMAYTAPERVQRGLNFAVVDEVDSILIDEARTPLIISGQADDNIDLYAQINLLAPKLTRQEKEDSTEGDFWVDEKAHQVILSEQGHEHAEQLLTEAGLIGPGDSLYATTNIGLMHHLYAALRAHALYHRDQHYVVQDGEVVIVDEFTGRLMSGRRWGEGLHQAVEAKEGLVINKENQTLATITLQNYFRMYSKLSGMTGTADTEAYEFQQIYGLETVIIPTNRPMVRRDMNDQVFRTSAEKFGAILVDIKDCQERGQPVLVGTTSIENSELLSSQLTEAGYAHNVLNAKQHAREAEIIVQAGSPGMITIATNMAGRGTDIVLGGNIEPQIKRVEADASLSETEKRLAVDKLRAEWTILHDKVVASGGLHIIGTERHESRRIDNQLRGRAGRQGDPGSSRFYLGMEDQLLRIFAADRIGALMERLKLPEGEAIESSLLSRAIENAQRKVEGRNFDIRKQLLEYDDVSNEQRKAIYAQRNELLESTDISETIANLRDGVLADTVEQYLPAGSMEEQWDVPGLEKALLEFQLTVPVSQWLKDETALEIEQLKERVVAAARDAYIAKTDAVGVDVMRHFERALMLQILDQHWREHLSSLDHLRQGIHLRSYGQKNPKQEYKREAFELFEGLLMQIRREVVQLVMTVQIRSQEDVEALAQHDEPEMQFHHADYDEALAAKPADNAADPQTRAYEKIGRNDLCPCGSGQKYKHCHGKLA
ncbi:preprotein translocase subunit SecA [Chitinimonas arctica]|uniref:Protein translocase subunit SecA n=1 Tax=Chitinimonas arctica TaxID=2594795 RepID=A0A516SF33_9NEIS|nr:preprotein translocase subunit SecA [Chitinimonas arctica]QDQ26764.1 preprotein translocase subunit SecA [Chitinimonas arctica]